MHRCINIHIFSIRKRRENARQHIRLNPRCNRKLCSDSLLLGGHLGKSADVVTDFPVHLLKGSGKLLNLIPCMYINLKYLSGFQIAYHLSGCLI